MSPGLDAECGQPCALLVAEPVPVAALGGEPAADVLAVPGLDGGDGGQAGALGQELGEAR